MFRVITEVGAKQDWNDAVDWYDEQNPGVGLRLNDAILEILQILSKDPERFPLVGRLTRKARIIGWPYSIYFTVNFEHGEVKIITIWHGNRSPVELRQRLT